jgi:hypothetical protein
VEEQGELLMQEILQVEQVLLKDHHLKLELEQEVLVEEEVELKYQEDLQLVIMVETARLYLDSYK